MSEQGGIFRRLNYSSIMLYSQEQKEEKDNGFVQMKKLVKLAQWKLKETS